MTSSNRHPLLSLLFASSLLFITSSFTSARLTGQPSVTPLASGTTPESLSHPIELHHSLAAPFDRSTVYFNYGGSTVVTNRFFRLTPATQDMKGWIWNEYPLESENWEIAVNLKIHSKPHFGGDGMAIWFLHSDMDPSYINTNPKNYVNPDYPSTPTSGPPRPFHGPIFGMKRNFKGVGVCIDIYDNDNRRNNPVIFVLQNDRKTKDFNHDADYEEEMLKEKAEVGVGSSGAYRCVADVRNTGLSTRILIKFLHRILYVYIDNQEGAGWKFCLAVKLNQTLMNYHMALTAATGQVADMHDIEQITTRYLSSSDQLSQDDAVWGYVGDHNTSHYTMSSLFWLLVNAVNCSLIAVAIYQLYTYHTLLKNRIDLIAICNQINPLVVPHYTTHAVMTLLFLLTGNFRACLMNLPLLAYRVYEFVTKQYLFTANTIAAAKGHAKGKVSPTIRLSSVAAFLIGCEIYYLYRLAV